MVPQSVLAIPERLRGVFVGAIQIHVCLYLALPLERPVRRLPTRRVSLRWPRNVEYLKDGGGVSFRKKLGEEHASAVTNRIAQTFALFSAGEANG